TSRRARSRSPHRTTASPSCPNRCRLRSRSPTSRSSTARMRACASKAARFSPCSTIPRPRPAPRTATTSSSASSSCWTRRREGCLPPTPSLPTSEGVGSLMPKSTDIQSILIIGAGPIVIGQACEFDYSGAQACKALRAEGYRIVLVNSNPATIMTDPGLADATYIEPITPEFVEKIIARESGNVPKGRTFALLPTMGGQTALNTALDLYENGVLDKYGVEMIGAKAAAIAKAEDRQLFREAMERIGLESPRSVFVHTGKEALAALE